MGFWIFMLIMDLLIPAIVTGFGRMFRKNPPRDINYAFGYRTRRSMLNNDTWLFAQKMMGEIWYKTGLLMFCTVLPMIFVINAGEDTVSLVGGAICIVQIAAIMLTIIPVERALKNTFDEKGNRKQ